MIFAGAESYRRGFVLSSAMNVAARALAFFNTLCIAFFFGAGRQADVYFFCVTTALLVSGFFTGFASSVLIPEAMHIMEERGNGAAMEFLNFFIYLCAAISVALFFLMIARPETVYGLFSRFDSPTLAAHRHLLFLTAPVIPLMSLSLILSDVMNSCRYFSFPIIVSLLNSAFSITFILLLHGRLGIGSALYGLIAGYGLNVAILLYTMRTRLGWTVRCSVKCLSRRILVNTGLSEAGNLATLLGGYVPMFLLSGFPAGTITALTFGRQIAELPHQFITRQFSAVSAIKFNELHARGDTAGMNATFLSASKTLAFLLLPLTALMVLFSEDIVHIVFRHGAFDEPAAAQAALFLRYFALPLALAGFSTILTRIYMAAQLIRVSFVVQIGANLLVLAFMIALIGRYGARAYPMAVLAAVVLELAVHRFIFRKVAPYIAFDSFARHFALLASVNACLAAALYPLFYVRVHLHRYVFVSAGCALYGTALFGINAAAKLNTDITGAWRTAARKPEKKRLT